MVRAGCATSGATGGGSGMPTAIFLRLLLAAALALYCGFDGASAQDSTCGGVEQPPCPPPTRGSHHDNTGAYVIGGIVVGFIGLIIGSKIFSNPGPPDVPP